MLQPVGLEPINKPKKIKNCTPERKYLLKKLWLNGRMVIAIVKKQQQQTILLG